jgi:hypothetical protein
MLIEKVAILVTALTLVLKMQARLSVDLGQLPVDAWESRRGRTGPYRRVHYHLGLLFGAGGIEWQLLHNGKVMTSVECEYM